MNMILLEIDSSLKRVLLSKLAAVGLLAMKVCENKNCSSVSEKHSSKYDRQKVEIYAEEHSVSRIIKIIVKLARDGILGKSAIKVLTVVPVV